jgi:hypothetical protein
MIKGNKELLHLVLPKLELLGGVKYAHSFPVSINTTGVVDTERVDHGGQLVVSVLFRNYSLQNNKDLKLVGCLAIKLTS